MALSLKLDFGALAPFISTQLDNAGLKLYYEKEKVQHFEKLRTAIRELYFNGFLTDNQSATMRSKLMRQVCKHLEEMDKKIEAEARKEKLNA